jgi:hypothetical protein
MPTGWTASSHLLSRSESNEIGCRLGKDKRPMELAASEKIKIYGSPVIATMSRVFKYERER